jgi:malate dehydrogenase (oxaloacetate-decarboxylating)
MGDYGMESLALHRERRGKWEMTSRFPLESRNDLSVAYTPGVAAVCEAIRDDVEEAYPLTMKGNSVAIVSDGSAVLGLGNIGPEAALPVMEGKAILFKEFAGIDGVPIVVRGQRKGDIINTVKAIAPTFGGINLEDIAGPKCFDIEAALQDIGIPVMHDDQHGTAVVLLAALFNAAKILGKKLPEMTAVVNGAGAAGTAIAKLLRCFGPEGNDDVSVKDIFVCDRDGIVSRHRGDLDAHKLQLLNYTNKADRQGDLIEAMRGADVFIGVSVGKVVTDAHIKVMADDPIILAMANPIPEIMPDDAKTAGAAIVGTGRSDFPNQVNNVLAFPGIFRGALDARASRITEAMKIAAAHALANAVPDATPDKILPDPLDRSIAPMVAKAVAEAAE